jgi:hypothetical protein
MYVSVSASASLYAEYGDRCIIRSFSPKQKEHSATRGISSTVSYV